MPAREYFSTKYLLFILNRSFLRSTLALCCSAKICCDQKRFLIDLRPFLTQTVGFVSRKRPFSTEAQIGLSFVHSRRRAFSTQCSTLLFSTEFSAWGIQSKNLTFSTGSVKSKKTQSKKFYTCFWNPSHRSSHHKTHTHTATHP